MKQCIRFCPNLMLWKKITQKPNFQHVAAGTANFSQKLARCFSQPASFESVIELEPTDKKPETHRDFDPRKLKELYKKSLEHEDFFGLNDLVTVEDLFKARVHYGHKLGSRNENMKEFLFGCRMDVDVFDLDKTLIHTKKALNFLAHMAFRKGIILFICRSPIHGHNVEVMAKECGEYAQTRFWHRGIFTNASNVFHTYASEVRLPDVCVFLSLVDRLGKPHEAVAEAAKMSMATVGLVDSNVNPSLITYPIPGNDDSIQSVQLFCRLFKTAVLRGKEKRNEMELTLVGENA